MSAPPTEPNIERWLAGLLGRDFLLWTPQVMEQGFLHWQRIYATRKVLAGTPIPLPRAEREIEVEYEFLGRRRGIEDLMEDEHLSGLLVLKDGEILLERYGLGLDPSGTWQSSSMVKSLTSILFGAALHDGYLSSLDELVTDHLPEFGGSVYEGVTIRHLLQMAGGLRFDENYEDLHADVAMKYLNHIAERRAGAVLEDLQTLQRVHAPGEQFAYNTGDTFLLSHILSRAVGKTVSQYCSERVWKPMGMEVDGYFLLDSDEGHEVTGSCSGASLRDYARLGLLMLRDGIALNGERVLPEGYVAESTAPSSPGFDYQLWSKEEAPEHQFLGYGYLWWVMREGSFGALGVYGQWIHVEPGEGLVVVMIGATPRPCYMDPSEPVAQVSGSQHGSPARLIFVDALKDALNVQRDD